MQHVLRISLTSFHGYSHSKKMCILESQLDEKTKNH